MVEGYIKFKSGHQRGSLPIIPFFHRLIRARNRLYDLKLIGMLESGIGFGNISIRVQRNKFLITGSATGNKAILLKRDFAFVTDMTIPKNTVFYKGITPPSSESMSHGIIYRTLPCARCVIHVHHRDLFNKMLNGNADKTPEEVAYGTPEFANSIEALLINKNKPEGCFVAAGHQDGVFVFGSSIRSAMKSMSILYNTL